MHAGAPLFMSIAGEIVTFVLYFQFWCLAALAYDMDRKIAWLDVLVLWREAISVNKDYFLRLPLRFWFYSYLYRLVFFLPLMIPLLIISVSSSSGSSLDFDQVKNVFLAAFMLTDFLSCFLLVRIFLAPQLAMLEENDEETVAKSTMEESICAVKEDYRRVLGMFIIPWFLVDAGIFLFGWFYGGHALDGITAIASLLIMAVIEGGRASFIIAGFNQFFSEKYRDASFPQRSEGRGYQPPEPVQGDVPGV